MKQIEKKKEKNSKKILSLHSCLFSFVRCLARKTNPITSSFNLFRVLSLSLCSSLSNNNPRFIFKGSSKGVLFCSAKSFFVTVFTAVILLNDDERERDIYHTHRRRSTNVATTDDERTISKSKVGTVLRAL